MNDRVICTRAILAETLSIVRRDGLSGVESVVLWLGSRHGTEGGGNVLSVYRPIHTARRDRFHIAETGMRELMGQLRARRQTLLAQVHTHPGEAFHSQADDEWAVVTHEGALSVVLPRFAANTDVDSFMEDAASYRVSADGRWLRVSSATGMEVVDVDQ
jgi:hypothetical protein